MTTAARAEFYTRLRERRLAPLWEVLSALVPRTPKSPAAFAKWSYPEIEPLLLEAGGLITAAEAERRVLILENPAMPGRSRITNTLYAGLQLILPGEVAPAHRHTQNALRFVMAGDGAFTALDGERAVMHKYDLVLTPNWVWHDHGNDSKEPMIWLDGLDIPLIESLDAGFAEHRPTRDAIPTTPAGSSGQFFSIPFQEWRDALGSGDVDSHQARLRELTKPDGSPILHTMSAFSRLVPAGFTTRPMRESDASIHVVVEGRGTLNIDGRAVALSQGDIFVVPTWAERSFAATSELVLFSYSDKSLQQKLSLWREERL